MKDEKPTTAQEDPGTESGTSTEPPPPFEPDERLITFIERGQTPPKPRPQD